MSLANLISRVLFVGPLLPLRFRLVLPEVNLRYTGRHRVHFEFSYFIASMVQPSPS